MSVGKGDLIQKQSCPPTACFKDVMLTLSFRINSGHNDAFQVKRVEPHKSASCLLILIIEDKTN